MLKSDEEVYVTIVTVSVLIFILGVVVVISIMRYQNSIQKLINLKAQYDQEILTSQIEVQNTTLQYIGRELHDNIGQLLSVAKINLNVLEETTQNTENEDFIKQTNELIEQSIHELRALSKSLDGDFVYDFGLQESIAHELQRIKKTRKFETELIIHGEKNTLGYEREIVLFRIVQEILNNALKHSNAQTIVISISYTPNNFVLAVTDDGKGFDIETSLKNELSQSGSGLRNIKRRAALINFDCKIDSQINQGTKYILSSTNLLKSK